MLDARPLNVLLSGGVGDDELPTLKVDDVGPVAESMHEPKYVLAPLELPQPKLRLVEVTLLGRPTEKLPGGFGGL